MALPVFLLRPCFSFVMMIQDGLCFCNILSWCLLNAFSVLCLSLTVSSHFYLSFPWACSSLFRDSHAWFLEEPNRDPSLISWIRWWGSSTVLGIVSFFVVLSEVGNTTRTFSGYFHSTDWIYSECKDERCMSCEKESCHTIICDIEVVISHCLRFC
jgi:hypothetical protein